MAPRVLAATTDLFLQSRITEVAKSLGLEAEFVSDEAGLEAAVKSVYPILVILDLSSTEYDPFSCTQAVKSVSSSLRILGFFPHVRAELRTRAENAGVDYVVPNSGLLKTLKKVLTDELGRI